MTWEDALSDLLDDLETQAQGMALVTRAEDVADLATMEYAEVSLEARLDGSLGHLVVLDLAGGGGVQGTLVRVARGCAVVSRESAVGRTVLVNLDHVLAVRTSSTRASAEEGRPVTARLGLSSALRHLVAETGALSLRLQDGRSLTADVLRVGADFVELMGPGPTQQTGETVLIPMRVVVTAEPA